MTSASASRHGLAGLDRLECGELCELAAHDLGGPEQDAGALARRRVAPRRKGAPGGLHGGFGLVRTGDLDCAHHASRPGRIDRCHSARAAPLAPVDQQRLVTRRPVGDQAQRLERCAPALESGEVGVGLVDERTGRGGVGRADHRQVRRRLVELRRGRRRRDQLLDVGALGEGVAQERLVGGVLEQAAHEIGHAGNELADRRVLAQPQAERAHGRLDGVAHAVQHLDLEAVVGHAETAGGGHGGRERPHVVAGEGRAHDVDALQHEAREAFVGDVRIGLVREDRHGPALLPGENGLVVPVSALDEAHGQRPAAAAPPGDQGLQVVAGVAQVGLHDHAGLVEAAKLLFVEQLGEDGEGEVAIAELLEIEVDEGAAFAGPGHDRPQGVLDGLDRAAKVERVDLRVERGDLDRDVDPGQRSPGRAVDGGRLGPGLSLAGQVVQEVEVALLVGGGLAGADRRLAEHVDRESQAAVAQRPEAGQRRAGVAADDEAARERQHLGVYDAGGGRTQWRAPAGGADRQAQRARRRDA